MGTIAPTLSGHVCTPAERVKYLGIWFNSRGTFGDHAREQAKRGAVKAVILTRLMANQGGPCAAKRRIIATSATSLMLYAAPLWEENLKPTHWNELEKVQRRLALRICSGYRTVSYAAAQVIAGTPPIQLMAQRAGRIHNGTSRSEADELLYAQWQRRWDEDEKGRWTHRLIPDILPWIKRRTGDPEFHLTQVLSGHGAFGQYLNRVQRRASDQCHTCCTTDTAEHRLFHCRRFSEARDACWENTGRLTAETIVAGMTNNEEHWRAVSRLAKAVTEQ